MTATASYWRLFERSAPFVPLLSAAHDSGRVRGVLEMDFTAGLELLARRYPGNSDEWVKCWDAYERAYAQACLYVDAGRAMRRFSV